MVANPDRVLIFDTTLRDGEQSPGCSMTRPEKLRVARALAELGVDVIEAGFPAASRGDFESVQAVAREVQGPIICALARCNFEDIELAARALSDAPRHRLHVFLATSAIHRQYKLNMAQEEILRLCAAGVTRARELCADVEFSPEDASRTELEFLAQVIEVAITAGATTVNIPDTVGYTVPDEFAELFRYLRKNVRGIEGVRLSVHCHAAINTSRLYPTSRLISSITGMPIPRNKAVVGENAFAHEAGIHQHGMLKHHSTYEILRPEDVGLSRSHLVLGKHSGRHAFRERVSALGFELDELEFNRVFEEFKALADKKKELFDGDIEALVLRSEGSASGPWTLIELATEARSNCPARALVRLEHSDGRSVELSASGDGPVDAAFKAIEAATGIAVVLRKFEVHAVSEGEDAQGEARVYVEYNHKTYRGASVSTNIVESGTRAFLEVINRIELAQAGARVREERSATTPAATTPA
ncbi:MAG: 2-isopropylmalate synthase [Gammaproteobacteria bacterium]|nr:MAG: 2-isopropylmalate synthase [Gammaproteobacteria bacterium]